MQHRIILSKTLLIAVKNKKKESKPIVRGVPVSSTTPRIGNPQKKYVRYPTLAGLTRIRVEEIFNY